MIRRWYSNTSPALWVLPKLDTASWSVGGITPSGYDAYHPQHEPEGYAGGSLPQPERDALIDHLVEATTTPEACWFLVWEGSGSIGDGIDAQRVHHPRRDHLLTSGSVADARSSLMECWDQSPTMWWPEDRSWFVSTEVDFAWSYLAASQALAEEVLTDRRLEAFVVDRSDVHTYDSDLLNATLDDRK